MKTLEKQQAVTLRTEGLSYREIEAQLDVSRSSLHRWLHEIALSDVHQRRIHQKNFFIRQKFIEYNHRKSIQSREQKSAIEHQAAAEINSLTMRELQLIGTALYWAEGTKGAQTSVVEFVNTDPEMINLMMRWFRKCCGVGEHKFRARVQLHNSARRQESEHFWSNVTQIPTQQFTQPILKISSTSRGKMGNRLPYGTLHIRIADVHLLTRIQGWIRGLSLAPSSSPA